MQSSSIMLGVWRGRCVSGLLGALGMLAGLPSLALAQAGEHGGDHAPDTSVPATSREGSGTAWLPDSTPVHGIHLAVGGFRWMIHGQVYGGINWQATERGDTEVISTNWLMAMASRPIAGGDAMLRAMLSLEPLTVGPDGYALLGQSGETYEGRPLVDRQHPHDLIMELAARARWRIAGPLEIEVYGGPAGEPALGPVAFPHRPSAMPSPLAPLGHHWLDSTHITFGVVTAGVGTRRLKAEGSWFNGREPDEGRFDLDLRGFDSVSLRLAAMPNDDLSVQASWAYLGSPEALEPEIAVQRVTASVAHNWDLGAGRSWSTTLAWGRNVPGDGPTTDALLAESALDAGRLGISFVRLEQVDKESDEMGIPAATVEEVRVHGVAVGHLHELGVLGGVRPGIGAVAHVTHVVDDALAERYGRSFLLGAMVYLTLRPAAASAIHH